VRIDILTIFPDMFAGVFAEGIVRKAQEEGRVEIRVHNLRRWAPGRHQVTDDYAFGGGPGMVMKPEPIFAAVDELRTPDSRVVLLTPQGRPFRQSVAAEYARLRHLVLICGRYEGVDERVRLAACDDEVSIGDYVLTGGEIPAMVVVDAVVRLLPGVLAPGAAAEESFASGLLEGPHYTRPRVFRGLAVPEVLVSGHHAQVARWRRKEAIRRTYLRRPDLLAAAPLGEEDRRLLAEVEREEARRQGDPDGEPARRGEDRPPRSDPGSGREPDGEAAAPR
jgi:tRNA (guanine37-N1)-methyltransferase